VSLAPSDSHDTRALQYDNEFWRFSLAAYGHDDVAEECLRLQQSLGIDINLLLFCAWLGTRGIALSKAEIEAASSAVTAWHENVVRPLRGARQYIKKLERTDLESYRTKVKGMELDAEQIEQAMLFAHSKTFQSSHADNKLEATAQNIKNYIAMTSSTAPLFAPHLIEAARRLGA
jgi:uncharacterized protein (TIGR02444 family)